MARRTGTAQPSSYGDDFSKRGLLDRLGGRNHGDAGGCTARNRPFDQLRRGELCPHSRLSEHVGGRHPDQRSRGGGRRRPFVAGTPTGGERRELVGTLCPHPSRFGRRPNWRDRVDPGRAATHWAAGPQSGTRFAGSTCPVRRNKSSGVLLKQIDLTSRYSPCVAAWSLQILHFY